MIHLKVISFLSLLFIWGCIGSQAEQQHTDLSNPAPKLVATPFLDTLFTFETYPVGQKPTDWSQAFTGRKGEQPNWQIVADEKNKVLAQLSKDNPNRHYNEIVFKDIVTKDVSLVVKLKGVSGRADQGGGFVWRYTDANNYYVVRANPLEDNVVLYKVKNGTRTDLPLVGKGKTYGVDVPTLGAGWNTLKVLVEGDLFTVYLNGVELFKVQDTTFENAGKVGLWTKADAVTYFDDFEIKSL